jgi:hypothetical protein
MRLNELLHESIKTALDIYSHLYPNKDISLADALNGFRASANTQDWVLKVPIFNS